MPAPEVTPFPLTEADRLRHLANTSDDPDQLRDLCHHLITRADPATPAPAKSPDPQPAA